MKTIRLAAWFTAALALSCGKGSSPYCSKAQECSSKAGTVYSATQCETDARIASEKAASVNCGREYDELVNCYSTLTCEQLSSGTGISTNCGGKSNAFSRCYGSTGGGSSGAVSQSTACRNYIACYEKTGGTRGVLDSTYGPSGSCWDGSSTAQACTNACISGNDSFRSGIGADAGCVF